MAAGNDLRGAIVIGEIIEVPDSADSMNPGDVAVHAAVIVPMKRLWGLARVTINRKIC